MFTRQLAIIFCLVVAVVSLCLGGEPKTEVPTPMKVEPITLKAISFLPLTDREVHGLLWFKDRVAERSDGKLIIKIVGGPEAIPLFDQSMALTKGIVNMSLGCTAFYQRRVPAAAAIALSHITMEEERKGGFYDAFNELHQKVLNQYYIGRAMMERGDNIFIKRHIDRLSDLKKLRIRGSPKYNALMEALEIKMVSMPLEDVYGALEKGIVDGVITAFAHFYSNRYYEVCKHTIDCRMFEAGNAAFLVNLDVWNSLPKAFQELLKKVAIEYEQTQRPYWLQHVENATKGLRDAGVKFIKISPEEANYFIKLADHTSWEEIKDKSPEWYARLKPLISK